MNRERIWSILALVAIIVATAVRALALNEGLWMDEIVSVETATLEWTQLLKHVAFSDAHPPLYYLVLSGWRFLFGTSEVALRSLSLASAFGTLVAVWYWLKPRGAWQAFIAVLLLSVSTFHLHYSVEVRPYSLLTFLAVVWLLMYRRALHDERPSARFWWTFIVVEILLTYTSYASMLIVLPANLHFFTVRQHRPRRLFWWTFSQAATLAAGTFWIPLYLIQYFHLPQVMPMAQGVQDSTLITLLAFGMAPVHPSMFVAWGCAVLVITPAACAMVLTFVQSEKPKYVPLQRRTLQMRLWWAVGSIAVILIALSGPVLVCLYLDVSTASMNYLLLELPKAYLLLFGFVFTLLAGVILNRYVIKRGHRFWAAPMILLLAPVVMVPLSMGNVAYHPRYLLILLPLVYALAAHCWVPRGWLPKTALVLFILAAAIPSVFRENQYFEPRQDFRQVSQNIKRLKTRHQDNTLTVVLPMWDRPGLEYYLGQGEAMGVMGVGQLPPRESLPDVVNVVLTRHAYDRSDAYASAFGQLLSPDYRLTDVSRLRQIVQVTYQKIQKGSKP